MKRKAIVSIGVLAFASMLVASRTAGGGEIAQTDRAGRISAMDLQGDFLDVRTDVRVPMDGWRRIVGLDRAAGVKASQSGGTKTWSGRLELGNGQSYRYEEALHEDAGAVCISLKVTAEADVKTDGVYFWLDVPVSAFAGGRCEASRPDAPAKSTPLPEARASQRHLLANTARRVWLTAPANAAMLDIALSRPCPVTVQDNREFQNRTYSVFVRLDEAQLAKGQAAELSVRLKLTGQGDRAPAALAVNPAKVRYRLDGFGGNYCFGIESPVTQYTLKELRVAWARTEMTPAEWEPTNDNASPQETDWAFLTGHDKPGSNLRREFLLAQQIQKMGIPYAISIWHLPGWLHETPPRPGAQSRTRITDRQWPELLECIGSYLVHAKKQYGVEPDLFSFNEPDIGVYVLLSPEEHREAIKRIGAHFKSLGLRTKLLLGDVCNPRDKVKYCLPAAGDPQAMQYVGAVSFHSWGGATPQQYAAWGDLAEKLKLPLLVAELGVDAGAWRGATYRSFHYGLREVQMYQEIVLYARPQGTMQWEFTSDYSLVDAPRGGAGGAGALAPTARFFFVKHFCDLTPPKACVLETRSDHPKVLVTAFAAPAEKGGAFTLHVANLAGERAATITGLPADIKSLRAVRTSQAESFKDLPPVAVQDGTAKLTLTQRSLLTLTTLPAK